MRAVSLPTLYEPRNSSCRNAEGQRTDSIGLIEATAQLRRMESILPGNVGDGLVELRVGEIERPQAHGPTKLPDGLIKTPLDSQFL